MNNTVRKIYKNRKFRFALGTVLFVLLWWLLAAIVNQRAILPTPWQTIAAFPEIFKTTLVFKKIMATLGRTLLGFALSFIVGAAMALFSLKPAVEDVFKPVISFLRSMPTLVLTIFLVARFNENNTPVVIGMMMTFPVVYTGLLTALKNVDKNLLEMAKIYKVKEGRITGTIYYRSVLPYILSTAESSLGMSFKVVISAEVLVVPVLSIGREIQRLQPLLKIPEVFAWIVVVLIITFLLESLIGLLRRLFVKWQ